MARTVFIKSFDVKMEIKTNGIELDVSNNEGAHMGDCYVTKTGITWCQGKITEENGKRIGWDEFARYMQERQR